MIADAVHSLSDLLTDAVTYITHRLAREPWTERYSLFNVLISPHL